MPLNYFRGQIMSGDPLFDSLTLGCDFDTKRFQKDAIRLGLVKNDSHTSTETSKLDKKLKSLKIYSAFHKIYSTRKFYTSNKLEYQFQKTQPAFALLLANFFEQSVISGLPK